MVVAPVGWDRDDGGHIVWEFGIAKMSWFGIRELFARFCRIA